MSQALASLTATYTDSEGEEEEAHDNEGSVMLKSPTGSGSDNKSTTSSRPSSPMPVRVTSVTTKVAKLVSYHDDAVASDDDESPHEVIMLTDFKEQIAEMEVSIEDDNLIPPEPPGHCATELQEKINGYVERMKREPMDMNAVIQERKDFRNPSIYEKLIQFCELNELGSNYPVAIYDPLKWSSESYYEELAKVQKIEMDKREKERKSKVEFLSGTKKLDDEKKRKTKWDQPGGGGGGNSIATVKPAGLVQPSLTNSATGTKSTVISAFGSLPKKPRP